MKYNKLLERQIKKCLSPESLSSPEVKQFLALVDQSYAAYESDAKYAERAFKISEDELIELNGVLKSELEVKARSISKLKELLEPLRTGTYPESDNLFQLSNQLSEIIREKQSAEKIYKTLITNLPNAIMLENSSRHIAFANQLFCDIFNIELPPEKLIGIDCEKSAEQIKNMFEHPDQFVAGVRRCLERREVSLGALFKTLDGRVLERAYIPIFMDDVYEGHLWSYSDVTQRYRAQDALAKSEQIKRDLLNASLDAIVFARADGLITFWNPAAATIFGWGQDDVVGKRTIAETIIPPTEFPNFQLALQSYYAQQSDPLLKHIVELKAVNKDGHTFPVEAYIIPLQQNEDLFFCGFIRDITQRKAHERELEMLSVLIQESHNMVALTDHEGRIIWVNNAFERVSEYSLSEVIGKLPSSFLSGPSTEPSVLRYLNDKIAQGEPFVCEIQNYSKSGKKYWTRINGQPRFDQNHVLTGFFSIEEDITSEREAKEKLNQAASRMESLITNLPAGVLLENEDNTIALVNQKYCNLFNLSSKPAEMIGKGSAATTNQLKQLLNNPDAFVNRITKIVSEKTTVLRDVLELKDGRYIERNFEPIWNEHQYLGHLWLYTDITSEVLAERKLEMHEAKYRNIIANMHLGLIEVDTNETIHYVNQAFCDMSGYAEHELLGKCARELISVDEHATLDLKQELRNSGISDTFEIRATNKSGEKRWWLVSGAPNYNDNGEMIGSIGIHLDITNQKNTENELIQAKEEAVKLSQAKEIFLANMSHEIRTPMNAIVGMTNQLSKTSLNEKQRFYLNTINAASENLLVIINDVLDIAKIEAGKMELEIIAFDPKVLLSKTLQLHNQKAQDKGLRLTSSFVDTTVSPVLIGDPHKLNQVINNLVSNSIKFTQSGLIDVTLRVRKSTETYQIIEISVSDTGLGMEADFLNRLFDKFSQEYLSVTRKFGGTGLGMSICKQLVELMGGEISVSSKKGLGTTVTFTVEMIVGSERDLPQQNNPDIRHDILANTTILVVDDNEMNRLIATTLLSNYGAKTVEAINGLMAVEVVATQKIDLVLMDIQMPEMSGFEATQFIRSKLHSDVPIIAMTANAIKGVSASCIEMGMNDYISKPFVEEHFISVIGKWLGNIRAIPETISKTEFAEHKLYSLNRLSTIFKGNEELIRKTVSLFIDMAPAVVNDIKEAYSRNDFSKIKSSAHRIKTSIDNLDMNALSPVVRKLELLDKEQYQSEEISQFIETMDTQITACVEALNGYLKKS